MKNGKLRSRRPLRWPRQTARRGRAGLFQDPEAMWDLKGKAAYVDPERRRRLPRWFIPLLSVILLAVLIFWGAPAAVVRLRAIFAADGTDPEPPPTRYGPAVWVVAAPVADVYVRDDLMAPRSAQVLYNEAVSHTARVTAAGFLHVRLADGFEGYMRHSDLSASHVSIEDADHIARLVVTDLTKRVFSHASNGTLLVETLLGTVLYTDYKGDGVYRVTLPDGSKGWVGANGVMELPLDAQAIPRAEDSRYFVNTALAFLNVPYIEYGISRFGACPEGIARLAAAVNGLILPRLLQEQMAVGAAVAVERDSDGKPVYEHWHHGDLVFFAAPEDASRPGSMGIYVDYGQVLTYRTGRSDIRILSLEESPMLRDHILAVRRLYTGTAR